MGNRIEIAARRSGKTLKTRLVVADALRRGHSAFVYTPGRGFERVVSVPGMPDGTQIKDKRRGR